MKYDYTFLDDRVSFKRHLPTKVEVASLLNTDFDDEDVSIWIFQGNPQRYDVLNALSERWSGLFGQETGFYKWEIALGS